MFNLSICALEDRYALDGEKISADCEQLLCDLLFDPCLTDGLFPEQDFETERRLLIETIEGRINDKRTYAISQMYETMMSNEPMGIPEGGGVEAVKALTREQALRFWHEMLQTAQIQLMVIGSMPPDSFYSSFYRKSEKSRTLFSPNSGSSRLFER